MFLDAEELGHIMDGESLTEKAKRDIGIGYRTTALVELRINKKRRQT